MSIERSFQKDYNKLEGEGEGEGRRKGGSLKMRKPSGLL